MTFAEFVKRYPSTVEIGELAIINEATPETTLEKGRLVKRVIGGELPNG